MKLLAIVYLIISIIFFVGIRISSFKDDKVYQILLLIATYIGYAILQYSIKIHIIIGFVIAAIIAYFYSLLTTNEEITKELGLTFKSTLFICIMSIISWPQILSLNFADYLVKKIKD